MRNKSRLRSVLMLFILFIFLAFVALAAYRLISGRSLGLKSFVNSRIYAVQSTLKTLANQQEVRQGSTGEYTNVIFLHHSVGNNLIRQGGVRELLTQAGYSFWDHDYNHLGLRDPEGKPTGYNYNIPSDNTDPDGLAALFEQRTFDLALNAFSRLLQHEVIIFKSCYPASDIPSEAQLNQLQAWYLGMRETWDQHPDKIFILVTQPPLNPAHTDLETAARARCLAEWLASPEFSDGHSNVFVFNFYELLADNDPSAPDAGMLRGEYREGSDSHPNQLANETIGPLFADFIVESTQDYHP